MQKTPSGSRIKIGLFGKRNAGKSSLINAITNQELAIVSDTAGTTTDPVAKAIEILPLGPCLIFDTAGLDDVGELGEKRIERTLKTLNKVDVAILVAAPGSWNELEEEFIEKAKKKKIALMVALNKSDLARHEESTKNFLKEKEIPFIEVSAQDKINIREVKEILIKIAPEGIMENQTILGDLIQGGDVVVLVTPIDLEAPKGRLILPQVQTIRDILDNDAISVVVKERELAFALRQFRMPPKLVVTDSQAVLKVAADVPHNIKMTTFSILFARYKGDLAELVKGAKALENLKDGDKVLIGEACTHHALADDIGRVKIPRWIRQYTGKDIDFEVASGFSFPDNLEEYKVVVHCGGYMIGRRQMLDRIGQASEKNVPMTNYGVAISLVQGVLERSLEPFPYEYSLFHE